MCVCSVHVCTVMWLECPCLNIHELACARACDLLRVGMCQRPCVDSGFYCLVYMSVCKSNSCVRVWGRDCYVIRSICEKMFLSAGLCALFYVTMMYAKESTRESLGPNFLVMEKNPPAAIFKGGIPGSHLILSG